MNMFYVKEKKMSTKIGILGYGNLGRGVECAIKQSDDMELVAVFTRRPPETVTILTKTAKVYNLEDAKNMTNDIDVMILCGGSATDLPEQTPMFAQLFNIVDSYDNHSHIPQHFATVNSASEKGKKVSAISIGWDPGMFSLHRLYSNSVLPSGTDYTFWGKGVSQGHSDAIRRIKGVANAKQYTVPVDEALRSVRAGENPALTTRQKHTRECFVVIINGADCSKIEHEIKTMPDYFEPYNTTVTFIGQEEFDKNHNNIPHGGFVIRSGKTGWNEEHSNVIEYSLKLDSNPEFTSSTLVAYARAVNRLHKEGQIGCKTAFDIAPAYLSPKTGAELRKNLL